MPEAGFFVSDDFESYSSTADVQAVYGAGNVFGIFAATGGRGPSKGLTGPLKCAQVAQDIANADIVDTVVGMAYNAPSGGARVEFWGPNSIGTIIRLLTVGDDGLGRIYYDMGGGQNPILTSIRTIAAWRYLEVQYYPDALFGHVHIALDGVRIFDWYGANAVRTALSYVIYDGLFDDIYARNPRTPDYLGNPVDYIHPTPNAVDFVGDYRLRHNLSQDHTTTGTSRVTQSMVNTAYKATLPNVAVTQQMVDVAYVPPKPMARVTQQYVIVAIKNKPGTRVRPQVVGIGRP